MIFVGGEFYYDDHWEMDSVYPFPKTHEFNYFLNGGQACLRAIADFLVDHDINQVLLPAYLCPTITKTLSQFNLRLDFYPVMEDFSINLESLAAKASNSKNQAIYFINYFGFTRSIAEQTLLQKLQAQGYLLVEDNAQAGFTEKPIGDFVFNSFRKFVSYDGAYLNTSFHLDQYINAHHGKQNRRIPLIRQYRQGLSRYLFQGEGETDELDSLFNQAEIFYEKDQVVLGVAQEKACIERQDWEGIRRTRRDNYAYLLKQIDGISGIKPIFPELQVNNMPIGLPIYFDGKSRDRVNALLGEEQIGLTIHWENMHQNPVTAAQKQAVTMSERILTLTVDQYTNRTQLDYLAEQLDKAISNSSRFN